MFTCLFDLVVIGQGELWDTLQGQKKTTEIHACKLELFDTYEASTLKELL